MTLTSNRRSKEPRLKNLGSLYVHLSPTRKRKRGTAPTLACASGSDPEMGLVRN